MYIILLGLRCCQGLPSRLLSACKDSFRRDRHCCRVGEVMLRDWRNRVSQLEKGVEKGYICLHACIIQNFVAMKDRVKLEVNR